MEGDLRALTAALVAVGAGRSPVLVVNPVQNTSLTLIAGPRFTIPIWPSNGIAVGTVIMVEPTSFASALRPHHNLKFPAKRSCNFKTPQRATPWPELRRKASGRPIRLRGARNCVRLGECGRLIAPI